MRRLDIESLTRKPHWQFKRRIWIARLSQSFVAHSTRNADREQLGNPIIEVSELPLKMPPG